MDRRVLVADDDADVRELVGRVLTDDLQVRVEEARDGYDAILHIREAPPDVLVLDLRMTGVDGPGVLHWLKSSRATAAIPVLVLTALDPEAALRTVERGPNRVLRKPFDLADLVAAVAALLPGDGRGLATAAGATAPN